MTERVPCIECGVAILPSTAERTGGLCMPCKGGYRQDIDAARERKALAARVRAGRAEAEHLRAEIELLFETPEVVNGLTHDERTYFSVLMLGLDVFDGGFDQYFWNSSADYYADALRGLKELGAVQARRHLIEAKEVLFGLGPIPKTHIRRRKMSSRHVGGNSRLEMVLLDLEEKFMSHSHSIVDRIDQFGKTRLIPAQ
ncbi:MAG TPA: DUF4375 domain-containing protein [Telluria sp.]